MSSAGGRITAGVGANLIGQHAQDRNLEATCYVGNLDEQVTDELLWELAVQAGPVGERFPLAHPAFFLFFKCTYGSCWLVTHVEHVRRC
jgi:hypothetical protein